MTRGRKPVPTKLKIVRGNPGKRAINKTEPEPEAAIPLPPAHLGEEAIKEWNRISVQLHDLGLLTAIDRPALAIYCVAWGTWVEATEQIKEMGSIGATKTGYPYQNPFIAIQKQASATMTKLLTEFGMTPSSRSRIGTEKKPATDDPFGKFEGKKA